jgi:two-component system, NtrC family, sensor kinase
MNLLDISIQSRVIIGISAMVFLFGSFLIAFITNQRKKLQYHKNLQAIHEQQQQALIQQNLQLEERVKERTIELSEQKESLQVALTDLKKSQLQLIQKEKMASLGEVASGIAHEIQNPLNFVNNFADVSSELLQELKDLIETQSLDETAKEEINSLAIDVIDNLHKINQHGKRADSIVKSMMQHAGNTSGQKELSDINVLVEEYLKLSYLGFRAKDNLFNAEITTNYDAALERIEMVPQDIGRVIMNICNNAFYSLREKVKMKLNDYKATLFISTRKEENKLIITIRDNGMGIPKKYLDKIFQPFFTTKPTGTGIGLGLSLAYDIIKAHQGELRVDSIEREFTEFSIQLLCE